MNAVTIVNLLPQLGDASGCAGWWFVEVRGGPETDEEQGCSSRWDLRAGKDKEAARVI